MLHFSFCFHYQHFSLALRNQVYHFTAILRRYINNQYFIGFMFGTIYLFY